ncbi:MAG: septum formation initiator family protein [Spirochaetaceae bacterium]|jgi:cell division protein FtsB|nr:septum formation initiator family protein [Spirochaetaceae bacterium]
MRALKYLMPLWIGIVIYSITAMTVGKTGLRAYDDLSREREKQRLNLEKLYGTNENLSGIRDALKYDSDTIAVYARGLGFGSEDERFIRIIGRENVRLPQMNEGETVPVETGNFTHDKTLRIMAICVAGALFLFLLFIDLLKALFGEDHEKERSW